MELSRRERDDADIEKDHIGGYLLALRRYTCIEIETCAKSHAGRAAGRSLSSVSYVARKIAIAPRVA